MSDAGAQGTAAARAEQARQAATSLVHAVYRLVKSCALHADTNQAVIKAATGATTLVADLAGRAEIDQITVLFTPNAIFVNGRILKMSRETFALGAELGTMLEACEANELTLAKDVAPAELARFSRLVSDAQRERALGAKLKEAALVGIRVRKVKALGADGGRREDDSGAGRAVRTFAQSIIVMREFYAALRAGERTLPNRVKRVAQKLVAHAEDDARRLVTLAIAAPPEPGPAVLAVTGTILAVAMGRQLTQDRRVLGSLAQAALLYDAGRERLLGEGEGLTTERALSEAELDRTPASEIHVLTAVGRIHQPAMARNVIAYEALHLRRQDSLGLPYGGRRPTSLAAHVLATARAFVELRAHSPGVVGLGIDEAIQMLSNRAEDAQQRTVVKLLVGALGIFPAGTLVELSTGEQAVVLATPALPIDFARPPVRILYDARARLLDEPFERDLAEPPLPGEPARVIRRTVDADDSQMKAMRSYVEASASSRRRVDSGSPDARRRLGSGGFGPDSVRRVHDAGAATDVRSASRGGEDSAARSRPSYDLTPTPSSGGLRMRVPSARIGSPVPPTEDPRMASPRSAPGSFNVPPSQDGRLGSPRPLPGSLAMGPAVPERTLPPVRLRGSGAPPPARESEPRSAPASSGRVGTLEWSSSESHSAFEELPELDTGLPVGGAPSSRGRAAWAAEPTPSPRAAADSPSSQGGRLSTAAGIRVPTPPSIYEVEPRSAPGRAKPEVEYEAGGATRQAMWNEVRDLLGVESPADELSPPTPPRPAVRMQAATPPRAPSNVSQRMRVPADEPAPSTGRARRAPEVDVSEPTRAGSGTVHDLLLAAYLADDPVDEGPKPAAPRADRPTPRGTAPVRTPTPARAPAPPPSRSVRAPGGPSHGLRWGGDQPPASTDEPPAPSRRRDPREE